MRLSKTGLESRTRIKKVYAPPASNPIEPRREHFPHLQHKAIWAGGAKGAADVFCTEMKKHGHYPTCKICGPPGGICIEGHIQSHNHLKRLWRKIEEARVEGIYALDIFQHDEFNEEDQVLMERMLKTLRFNHVDLSIRWCEGMPPPNIPHGGCGFQPPEFAWPGHPTGRAFERTTARRGTPR